MQAAAGETVDITSSTSPAQALAKVIDRAAPGVKVIYARTWFLTDVALATMARALYNQGRVDLVQQRIRTGRNDKFAYIAIKRNSPPAEQSADGCIDHEFHNRRP